MRSNDVTANGLADVVGLPRCPLNATRTLRMIENLIRVLMWFITDAYSSFVFFEILSANRLWYAVACGPHPPNVVYSRGVKVPFSTCSARMTDIVLSHLYLFFLHQQLLRRCNNNNNN